MLPRIDAHVCAIVSAVKAALSHKRLFDTKVRRRQRRTKYFGWSSFLLYLILANMGALIVLSLSGIITLAANLQNGRAHSIIQMLILIRTPI